MCTRAGRSPDWLAPGQCGISLLATTPSRRSTAWEIPPAVPDLKGVALGIGQADYGVDSVALMGVSAARMHGAIPRLAVAVLAVPKQRPPLRTGDARIVSWNAMCRGLTWNGAKPNSVRDRSRRLSKRCSPSRLDRLLAASKPLTQMKRPVRWEVRVDWPVLESLAAVNTGSEHSRPLSPLPEAVHMPDPAKMSSRPSEPLLAPSWK
jgi:hypothetical protein